MILLRYNYFDFYTIFLSDGNTTEIDRVCGSALPRPLESSSSTVTVTYRAGTNPLSWNGFSILFNTSAEGETIKYYNQIPIQYEE